MLRCWAYDVEALPNFFSITFVNLNDYLKKLECKNAKGKDIPLVEKYSVKEIKELLASVEQKQFWFSDFEDSGLLPLISFINSMAPKTENGVPVRYDLYGYNTLSYDDLMISALLMYFDKFDTTKQLLKFLYETSKHIVSTNKDMFYEDKQIKFLKTYKLPYASVDLMRVFALNKAGVLIDKNTGKRVPYGKSLKQTSINLQWYELLEWHMPPICEKDVHFYNKDIPIEELNKSIAPFDRFILPEYVEPMMHYNTNDVFICCEMVRMKSDEVRLRYSLSNSYKVNVLSAARSKIADVLVTKFYSDMSGLHPSRFTKLRTERTVLSFKKVIFPHIKFKTQQLQEFLEDIKKVSIRKLNKDEFSREIEFYGTTYTIATGGIHTQDTPVILRSTDKYTYKHHD